jgi:shikimate dehydrogenase
MSRPDRFVGVLGWPLDHTLSPVIHNAAFRSAGLDWVYLSWPVPPNSLEAAVMGLRALGATGANVTMPHKQPVIDFLDELSDEANDLGAVNTIHRRGQRLTGHNTDVTGFREFLAQDAGVEAEGRTAVVLGAGGAARAVVKALASLGAGEILIDARDRTRGEAVAQIGGPTAAMARDVGGAITRADLVVNATPVGMDGKSDPVPGVSFRPGQTMVDLVYLPPTTPLMRRARSEGAEVWGGLGMLVRQAAESFVIWTGRQPSLETMSAAAVRAIGSHSGKPQ